jgi:NTP pyrophosphatase (non-canonical NTP hydrolase)
MPLVEFHIHKLFYYCLFSMRNLQGLPIPDALKIELAHAATQFRSLYGVKADILEFDEKRLLVRIIQTQSLDGKRYTKKELALLGKEIMLPVKPYFEICHFRPVLLAGDGAKSSPDFHKLAPHSTLPMQNDIEQITQALLRFRNERDWEQFHNPKDLALAINIEAAELLELFLWKAPEDANQDKVKEELADVLSFALLLADKYGFDVKQIVLEKIEQNAVKYPVDKAKGTAKKYDEL